LKLTAKLSAKFPSLNKFTQQLFCFCFQSWELVVNGRAETMSGLTSQTKALPLYNAVLPTTKQPYPTGWALKDRDMEGFSEPMCSLITKWEIDSELLSHYVPEDYMV
jgi:hypothetical protein